MSQAIQPVGGGAIEPFREDTYIVRRNFFNFLGVKCRVLSPDERLLYFVHMKAFKLKEDITIFADEGETHPLLRIKARSILDFGATYDVTDVRTGQPLGAVRRQGLKSIIKDEWHILAPGDAVIGRCAEDSWVLALLRRFLAKFIPQNYHFYLGAEGEDPRQIVGDVHGTWNPFIVKCTIDLTRDQQRQLDRRLALVAAVMLMLIEGKQG